MRRPPDAGNDAAASRDATHAASKFLVAAIVGLARGALRQSVHPPPPGDVAAGSLECRAAVSSQIAGTAASASQKWGTPNG